jgi:hypothetical protein
LKSQSCACNFRSKETEITGGAKACQKELLEDYRDFMRNRRIEEWSLGILTERFD